VKRISGWLDWQLTSVEEVLDAVDIFDPTVDCYYVSSIQFGVTTGDNDLPTPFDGNHIDGIRQGEVFDHGVAAGVLFF
jgi:hypothetical protein